MDHYLDIRLLPDPEFTPTVLMDALFAKLHRALVDLASTQIGVSFPGRRKDPKCRDLGDLMRIHGFVGDLRNLMELSWLTGMRDHIDLYGPAPIPDRIGYCTVRRMQAKSSPERLRRRLAIRKGISEEEARRSIPDNKAKRLDLPYLAIKSRSTGQTFRLFIDQQPSALQSEDGVFNHYGFSRTATLPWF
ncbi:type I-F CRISPR-associated endoribonuclease Cas6/Csy4 [Thiocystis violacea]|uniref:type I-F CRISPR-associated endoribonuclease Cas6/Csy4 n=1 Tax=Thiocystis violacea TaxID=13725 RepID=UPI001905339A|nr:type I-F CRISPR-associated endoribonuclease Cas6/Csy4 [Thiocystis violacea]MBK1719358.1 type I-F CRISPR-associated endoribonuclease Cas6/Csy4 [Thiocystis violacea]